MNQEYGLRKHRSCVLLAALIAAIISGANAPAFAEGNWLLNRLAIHTPPAHETARVERSAAVENARNAFAHAVAAGAEKTAPYEYYLAKGYLKLAMKELAEGDKIGVMQFAAESAQYSRLAGEKAKVYPKLAREGLGAGNKIAAEFTAEAEQDSLAREKAKEGS